MLRSCEKRAAGKSARCVAPRNRPPAAATQGATLIESQVLHFSVAFFSFSFLFNSTKTPAEINKSKSDTSVTQRWVRKEPAHARATMIAGAAAEAVGPARRGLRGRLHRWKTEGPASRVSSGAHLLRGGGT